MDGTSVAGAGQLQDGAAGPLTCIEGNYCNKPSEGDTQYVIKPCRCASQFCWHCVLGQAVGLRERLRPAVHKWGGVLMLTLSLDQKQFDGPLEAWRYVGKKRAIAVMMQTLRRKKLLMGPEFFYVLEFHKKYPNWPHWHVLVNADFVSVEEVRDAWKLGHVFCSRTKPFESKDHAVHYATKYVAKPEVMCPAWVSATTENVRKYSTSRGLLPSERQRYQEPEDGIEKREYSRRTLGERMDKCGMGTKTFKVENGKWDYLGTKWFDDDALRKRSEEEEIARKFDQWVAGDLPK